MTNWQDRPRFDFGNSHKQAFYTLNLTPALLGCVRGVRATLREILR